MERIKWTYDILESVGFVKHKVVIGNSHNYIKGDFRINDAYPYFIYKNESLPKIIYLDDLAGIYFEKTGEHLKIENIMKQELIKLYALFDSGGQGMKDNGLLGVYTTKEEAEKIRGNNWYSIIEFDSNKIYADGVQYLG